MDYRRARRRMASTGASGDVHVAQDPLMEAEARRRDKMLADDAARRDKQREDREMVRRHREEGGRALHKDSPVNIMAGVVALARREGIVPGPYLDSQGMDLLHRPHARRARRTGPTATRSNAEPDEAIEGGGERIRPRPRQVRSPREQRGENYRSSSTSSTPWCRSTSTPARIHKAEFVKALNA